MTDQDWADEEAARLIPNHLTVFEIDDFRVFLADAMRKAEQRAYVAGIRWALGSVLEDAAAWLQEKGKKYHFAGETLIETARTLRQQIDLLTIGEPPTATPDGWAPRTQVKVVHLSQQLLHDGGNVIGPSLMQMFTMLAAEIDEIRAQLPAKDDGK